MKLEFVQGNLFSAEPNWSLAHCVAEDFIMGGGIALAFRQMFGQVDVLKGQKVKVGGVGLLTRSEADKSRLFYMVTKKKSWEEPDLKNIYAALESLAEMASDLCVTKIAMPLIGCGLDRKRWSQVCPLLKEAFRGLKIHIKIYYLPNDKHLLSL